ncbi:MAG: exodeoxyribonuclease VII large subunit [Gemmatimonadota bacterium]
MSLDLFSSAEEARRSMPPRSARSAANDSLAGSPLASLRAAGARPGQEWSVSEVNTAAKELIEGVFPPLWITGEIANFTRARSGHCYFTLRDDNSQLRCVMWRDEARRLPTAPEEGMAVRGLGRLTIYPSRGEFQLVVTELEGKGDGLWKLALERLRRKLEAEGLTDPARKRPLPRHPAVVGVVTSPSGAVFHDIVNVVRRRAPWTRVVLAGCRVQGDGSAAEVAAAIRLFGSLELADVLIVGRGGGSVEDLWAFNEEIVARAIAESPIPVISAVGHETDVTIADLVADLRAPTPSAAAESAVPDRTELARGLQRDGWRLRQAIAGRLGRAQDEVEYGRERLQEVGSRFTADRRERVRVAARHLEALSPLAAFARGFAVPLSTDGRIMRRPADFTRGRAFDLRLAQATVPCRVADDEEDRPS